MVAKMHWMIKGFVKEEWRGALLIHKKMMMIEAVASHALTHTHNHFHSPITGSLSTTHPYTLQTKS